MKLREIAEQLGMQIRVSGNGMDCDVVRGYASDLLSDVLAGSRDGDMWITLQNHPNIVAVASIRGVAGIVIANGREPTAETLEKAETEGITLLVSSLPVFELAGRLHRLGIAG